MTERLEREPEVKRRDEEPLEELLSREVDSGRGQFVAEERRRSESLKAGGRSGITGEFGMPVIVAESESASASGDALAKGGGRSRRSGRGEPPDGGRESEDGRRRDGRDGTAESAGPARYLGRPDFPGEIIRRDVRPEIHSVAWGGETLPDIARQHLGEGASEEEVAQHIREIERFNDLRPGQSIENRGSPLILPGHTDDGAIILPETQRDGFGFMRATGAERTIWPNGTERLQHQYHPGFVRRYDDNGGYSERHWGPRTEDNYHLQRTAEGRYLVANREGEQPVDRTDSDDIRVNRARWQEQGEQQATAESAERLRQSMRIMEAGGLASGDEARGFSMNMEAFERRAREQGVSPEEVRRTYEQVGRLLHDPSAERVELARQIMNQAAHPESVNQGFHNTCNVATIEAQTYARHPSDAARLVADVSLNGYYETRDHRCIVVTPDMIQHGEIEESGPGRRSYASEIFQVTAVNIHYQSLDSLRAIRYEQHVPERGMNPPDTGERLMDYTTGTPRLLTRSTGEGMEEWATSPGLSDDDVVGIAERISGPRDGPAMLASHERIDTYGGQRTERIDGEQDLRATLLRARRDGQLPLTVVVYTQNEPFFTDSGAGLAGGAGGAHVVTITDFDERNGTVSVDNQWGADADRQGSRAMRVSDLYLSMLEPGSAETIAARTRQEQREHDQRTELELLRQRHMGGQLSDAEFNQQFGDFLDQYMRSPRTQEMDARSINALLSLPPEDREQVYARIRDRNTRRMVSQRIQDIEDEIRRATEQQSS